MSKKYDLAIVLPHYESGGAQKVTQTLLDQFSKSGKNCALIVIFNKRQDKYLIPENVDRYDIFNTDNVGISQSPVLLKKYFNQNIIYALLIPKKVFNALKIVVNLRKTLINVNAKTVVSFLTVANILTIIASAFKTWKLVISERNDVSKQENIFPLPILRYFLYNEADIITANTKHSLLCMETYVNSTKLKYVPNPIDLPNELIMNTERKGFLFVGRLVPQKSVHTLVEAFSTINHRLDGWSLNIVGDGPELSKLQKIVQDYGMEEHIIFHGYQAVVSHYYKNNAIFILPSLYEGLPNVLLEAMTFAMPMIVSDSCPGSIELTTDGHCGLTFPTNDHIALSRQMIDLAKDKEKILLMGKNSRIKVEEFKTSNVLNTWHELIFE